MEFAGFCVCVCGEELAAECGVFGFWDWFEAAAVPLVDSVEGLIVEGSGRRPDGLFIVSSEEVKGGFGKQFPILAVVSGFSVQFSSNRTQVNREPYGFVGSALSGFHRRTSKLPSHISSLGD